MSIEVHPDESFIIKKEEYNRRNEEGKSEEEDITEGINEMQKKMREKSK